MCSSAILIPVFSPDYSRIIPDSLPSQLFSKLFRNNRLIPSPSLAGPDGFRLQETVWSQPQYLGEWAGILGMQ